jgi:protein-S-isoprenylcysteine O-methyltransferase Ste14
MFAFAYGVVVYVFFLATFIYAIGFVGNIGVPRGIDSPASAPAMESLLIDLALLALFAVQHSVMARKGFKAWWTKIVSPAIERSTYVLAASIVLGGLCWHWKPIEGVVWSVQDPRGVNAIQVVFWFGWVLLLLATFLINHFELFGLRQVFTQLMGHKKIPDPEFRTPFLYKHVRHPIYLGFVLSFWATPEMTLGHLLFAAGATGYILVGIWFEERDLIAHFGERYRDYRRKVPMLFPGISGRS